MEHTRVLPHSLEAERAVLGAALISPAMWPVVASKITANDFFRDGHRRVFVAMATLAARDVPIDLLTVVEELRRNEDLDEAGGNAYIASLVDGVPRSANAEHYAEIVKEKHRLRAAAETGQWLVDAAYMATLPAVDIVEEASRRLLDASTVSGKGLQSADVVVAEYVAALGGGTLGKPLTTGYTDLDALVGGFRPADLVIIAARPSVGKTSWVLGASNHMALQGDRTGIFSLEMSAQALGSRLLSYRCGVPVTRLERGEATDDEYRRAAEASAALYGEPPMLLIEDEVRTVTEIHAWCKRAQASGGLSCAVIDYIQLLAPEKRSDSRQDEIEVIARALKRLAKDLGIVVIALSQLSRAADSRRDKRPRLSDLRSSGALEQDADLVLLLFREELHKPTPENAGLAECITAKNRNGPVGVTRLQFEKSLMRFRDLAREE